MASRGMRVTRRQWCGATARVLAAAVSAHACGGAPSRPGARLAVRAGRTSDGPGEWRSVTEAAAALGGGVAVALPQTRSQEPLPLLVLLHGAGGNGRLMLDRVLGATGAVPAVVVAPTSTGPTWDALSAGPTTLFDVVEGAAPSRQFGADLAALERCLQQVFDSVAIDRTRVTLGGFSDGATYALALGLANGDLFSKVIALSPGFLLPVDAVGKPDVLVAHGRSDRVFPIDRCGRQIASALTRRGYRTQFQEFAGGHELPDAVVRHALSWAGRADG